MSNYPGGAAPAGSVNKLDMWAITNASFFPEERMPYLKDRLSRLPESHFDALYAVKLHNPTTILLFSIFLGELGVDRFMIGDTGIGIGKLLTCGGFLIWWIIDLFLIQGRTKEKNFENVINMLTHYGY